MSESLASWLLILVAVYAGAGVVFAVPFVLRGVNRIDPAAREGTRGFRILIFPGVVALWPLLAARWRAAHGEPPVERTAHRDVARGPAS